MHTCIICICLAYFWVAIKSAYWSSTLLEEEFSRILSWIVRESGLIQQTNEAWAVWRARAHTLISTLSRKTHALASKNTHTHSFIPGLNTLWHPSKGVVLLNYYEAASCVSWGQKDKAKAWARHDVRAHTHTHTHTHAHTHTHTHSVRERERPALYAKSIYKVDQTSPKCTDWLEICIINKQTKKKTTTEGAWAQRENSRKKEVLKRDERWKWTETAL